MTRWHDGVRAALDWHPLLLLLAAAGAYKREKTQMIHPGLCSLTLANLQPAEVVASCREAGLTHVEWWGRDHVPMGDRATAARVGRLTREAGLQVSTYGSYYRIGQDEEQGIAFDDVLQTALAMGAPAIRVWAGTRGSEACTDTERERIIAESDRIAELCAGAGLELVFEYHGGTLTDSSESAVAFANAVQHPAVYFGWQSRPGVDCDGNLECLRAMLPRLATLHVFDWSKEAGGELVRHPLEGALDDWRRYFKMVGETGREHVALLEFVRGNSVEQFREDARILKELVCL